MVSVKLFVVSTLSFLAHQISAECSDVPCAAKFYNESSVCVCNSTYCDTITRVTSFESGTFATYTSSKEGKRFYKQINDIQSRDPSVSDDEGNVFLLDPTIRYQNIEGFGGAVTDSAGINLKSLPLAAQRKLINSYFSDVGIEYNMLRLPIASTDFSTRIYSYDDYRNDTDLDNFKLAKEDYEYKIPFIQHAKDVATDDIHIVAASWSPPKWMKTKDSMVAGGSVKHRFMQDYAEYHCKFAEAYKKNGIDIWAMSTSNEPTSPLLRTPFQSTLWYVPDMGAFISKYLGPTLRNCSAEGIKLLTIDDQRGLIPLFSALFSIIAPEAIEYVDGFALHSYFNKITPPSMSTFLLKQFPDKFALVTEYCAGSSPSDEPKVDLGSWARAKDYVQDILENLNSNFVGWVDWNLCLNRQGGPTWVGNFVDSPIIVDAKKKEFYKQPMFYAMGHFSKFLPRGSQRIQMSAGADNQCDKCVKDPSKEYIAFMTPEDTIVVIIYNDGEAREATLRVGTCDVITQLDANSITTIEIPTTQHDENMDCKIVVD
ncbi:lysosomal acid glucosylceramidase-like [Danaus plexippus]|uniref:lysosomal acid glucosylceramidase-like n=1 Tax=Danaus plexippus TaxID=13037 RepID=UPI002AB1166B|nr:lysosomal acid glucosylceramidase-like [Danaus plexippus]